MTQTYTYKQRMRACIDIMKPCHGGGSLERKESDRGERETCLGYTVENRDPFINPQ